MLKKQALILEGRLVMPSEPPISAWNVDVASCKSAVAFVSLPVPSSEIRVPTLLNLDVLLDFKPLSVAVACRCTRFGGWTGNRLLPCECPASIETG